MHFAAVMLLTLARFSQYVNIILLRMSQKTKQLNGTFKSYYGILRYNITGAGSSFWLFSVSDTSPSNVASLRHLQGLHAGLPEILAIQVRMVATSVPPSAFISICITACRAEVFG